MASRRYSPAATRPAEVFVGAALGIVSFGEEAFLNGVAETTGFAFFELLQFVQTADEQEVGNLLDHFERLEMPPVQKAFQTWSI